MRSLWITLFMVLLALPGKAQSLIYHNLKDYVAGKADTIVAPRFITAEKRNKNQIILRVGGDYKLSSNKRWLRQGLKRYYAVQIDSALYINCKKVRINKFKFGKYYAPAFPIGDKIYFCAIPVGPAAVAVVHREIGMGVVGEAIASSAAVNQRVYYEIDTATGKVEFVGKDKMIQLLEPYPTLKKEYLKENNQEAVVTGKYLKKIR